MLLDTFSVLKPEFWVHVTSVGPLDKYPKANLVASCPKFESHRIDCVNYKVGKTESHCNNSSSKKKNNATK